MEWIRKYTIKFNEVLEYKCFRMSFSAGSDWNERGYFLKWLQLSFVVAMLLEFFAQFEIQKHYITFRSSLQMCPYIAHNKLTNVLIVLHIILQRNKLTMFFVNYRFCTRLSNSFFFWEFLKNFIGKRNSSGKTGKRHNCFPGWLWSSYSKSQL